MKIFDFLKKETGSFDSIYEAASKYSGSPQLGTEVKSKLKKKDDEYRTLLLIDILTRNMKGRKDVSYTGSRAFNLLVSSLTKKKILFGKHTNALLESVLSHINFFRRGKSGSSDDFTFLVKPVLDNIVWLHEFEEHKEKEILFEIKLALVFFEKTSASASVDIQQLVTAISDLLSGRRQKNTSHLAPIYFTGEDRFKDFGNSLINLCNTENKNLCFQIIRYSQSATGSRPSGKYLAKGSVLIEEFGEENFRNLSHQLFEYLIGLKDQSADDSSDVLEFLHRANADSLKGIVWMNVRFHDRNSVHIIGKLAERCFKKIPGVGAGAAGLGNACLYTLYASKGLEGIAQLSRLKLKVKQASSLTLIEKYIGEAADKMSLSAREIEDLSVDDYGLTNNKLEIVFGEVKAVLELAGIGKSVIKWYKEDGKEQKSVPVSVKEDYPDKLKSLKGIQKQVDQATSVQKDRFDRMLRTDQPITLEYLQSKYVNHRLLSFVINKVIFRFVNDDDVKLAIFLNQKWIGLDYKEVNVQNYTSVYLWHPVTSSTMEVKEWRQFLLDSQIQQPFKQAFREIYLLTDAEINTRTYSNRMASHILKQHQYVNLAKGRNWKAKLIGAWDGGDLDTAELKLPDFKIRVEYWVNAVNTDNHFNDIGVWNYVSTDQVRFLSTETNELIDLVDVPVIAFSEAMRDIDLFVGVASVGNDPTWQDSGGLPIYRDYWQLFSFGDLSEVAKNRKEILQGLIPRLKIAKVAHISDKFLVVKGKLRTYKIHIGSSNILMEPNDQYLCIVADRREKNHAENIFLPFEGDNGLSVIISKALLLANDDKITDTTITTQIRRS